MRNRTPGFCTVLLTAAFLLIAFPLLAATSTGNWTPTGEMTQPRNGAAAALLLDGRLLVIGGDGPDGPLATVEVYSNGVFSDGASLSTPRSGPTAATLNDGRVLVAGGRTVGGQPTWSAELYDPKTDQWSAAGDMAKGRAGHTMTLLPDGRVIVAGGTTVIGDGITDTIETFDPSSEKFSVATGVLSSPRTDHAAALLQDGRVLIAGGFDGNAALSSVDLFDPASGKVTPSRDELSSPRTSLTATTLLNGTVLLVGGSDGKSDLASAEIYNPVDDTLAAAKGRLAQGRSGHLAILLPHNNNVLIVGGTSAGKAVEWVELFKPSLGTTGPISRLVSRFKFWTNSFSSTGSLLQARTGAAAAALLDNGRLLVAGGSGLATAEVYTFTTITTDRPNYSGGDTIAISGSNWQAGETLTLRLQEDPKVHEDRAIKVEVDEHGNFSASELKMEGSGDSVRVYVTANDASSQAQGAIKQTGLKITPTANPSANLDQCANGSSGGVPCIGSAWQNGNLGQSQAHYFEGDSVPYRLRFDGLIAGVHSVTIEWDTTKGGKHALDYLTTWDRSAAPGSDACSGVSGCGSPTTFPIPTDPNVATAGVSQIPGNFTLYNGTITAVSAYTLSGSYAGDSSTRITIFFTTTAANPVLAWSGHIATRVDWGLNNSAVAIPGSPYHTRLIDIDGSGGNQDKSLSADAVIFPASITIVKQATPKSSTSFQFSSSDFGSFSLVDDGTNTSNSKSFTGIVTFQTYTFTETVPADWQLASINCTETSPNGGSTSSNTGTGTVTINLKEGENWTCTFNDNKKGHIVVDKVTNPSGDPQSFSFSTTGSGYSSFSLTDTAPPNDQQLVPGGYSVSETVAAGWDLTALSCSITTVGSGSSTWSTTATPVGPGGTGTATITLGAGDTVSCTFNNTKRCQQSCDDQNPCTTDSCDLSTNQCVHTAVANGTACDDNTVCNGRETCQSGTCTAGTPLNCDDGNVCTTDSCDPVSGCVHTNNTNPCDDGNACTTNDTCSGGKCVGGPALNCDDGNVCTDDSCNPATGCVHTNNTAPCNDGNACTTNDTCSNGTCVGGPPPNCNDNNPCTDDSCNPATGCVHTNNTAPCNDGNACTTNDTCSNGTCVGGPALNCDDGNVCTDDSCNPATGCVHTNNTTPCNDGNACTTNDTCSNGTCVGGPALNCDDGNVCTDDSCNPATGCVHTNNTAPCNDGNACTTNDTCSGGKCVGGPALNCDDGNVCTTDSCDPASGCVHTNNTNPCDDGNACTTNDTCSGGKCVGGPALNCNDNNACTVDSCNPASGCVHTAVNCDDNNVCTTDSCDPATGCTHTPISCDDNNACTADSCDPTSGCQHTNLTGTPCNDQIACTSGDFCQNGHCTGSNTCNAPASTQTSCSAAKFTGGGQFLKVNSTHKWSFGFNAKGTVSGTASGHFNAIDHYTGEQINGDVTAITCFNGTDTMTFQVTTKEGCLYQITVHDGGEPGRSVDNISITELNGSCTAQAPGTNPLDAGNIQSH